jgi:hypothetical protein
MIDFERNAYLRFVGENGEDYSFVYEELGLNPFYWNLNKSLNLYEHKEAMNMLVTVFNNIKKPDWIKAFKVERLFINRMPIIRVTIVVQPPISIKGVMPSVQTFLIKVRNFASREVFPRDLRNMPEGGKAQHVIVLCPEVSEQATEYAKKRGIMLWLIDKAFKLSGRRSKWQRRKQRRFEITNYLAEFGKAVLERCREVIRRAIKPLLDFIRKLLPQTWVIISYWLERHDLLEFDARILDAPPPEREQPIGYMRGYTWKGI